MNSATGQQISPAEAPKDLNLLAREVLLDPYPTYRSLRTHAPVLWSDELGGWVLTCYEDVRAALCDHETFSSRRVDRLVSARLVSARLVSARLGEAAPSLERFVHLASEWMWMIDPPDHSRVRKLTSQGFTPRAVRRLEPLVEEVVAVLVDRVVEFGEFDLIADFAYRLPAFVLADLFGIPRADAGLLKDWSDTIKIFIGGSPDMSGTASAAADGLNQMVDYLMEMIRARQVTPQDDLVSRLVEAREANDRLSEEELCLNLALIVAASYATTMDMIGNGVLALLSQPDQWELLKADPSLASSAVDEVLRYDTPVQMTHRLLTRDVELRGITMRRGQLTYLVRASANRDPEQYPDPDRVDITRSDTSHAAFGAGVHYCIGAGLARIEGVAAFTVLARRLPELHLRAGAVPVWRTDNLQFRGMRSLPMATGPVHPA